MSRDEWVAIGFLTLMAWFMARALFQPLALVLRGGLQMVVGGLALYLWDRLIPVPALAVGINPLTAAVTGWLGVPGFGLLMGLHWLSAHSALLTRLHWP